MVFFREDLSDAEITLKLVRTSEGQPDRNYLPSYCFNICLADGTYLGYCDFRVGHNENTYYGGNIGYTIIEEHRGHHYASKAVKLLLGLAERHGLDYILITCQPDNIASSKTCERAGGELIDTVSILENNEMYQRGRKSVKVYRFTL
ncbi:MAG: GNAT family N-acetyltransferase [Clostridiales bacterium]|nr:GNAT family N-acetyltransferase [Clostridiales bacterium]